MGRNVPQFSPQSIAALVQGVTGGSRDDNSPGRYRTGPTIEMFLGNCGVDCHVGSSSRIPAVRDVLTQINRSPDALARLKPVFENVVNPAEFRDFEKHLHQPLLEYLNAALRADGFELTARGDRFHLVSTSMNTAASASVLEAADALDLDTVRHHLDQALEAVTVNPADAITSACATLESVCSTILVRMNREIPADRSIGPLFREAARWLNLSLDRPDLVPDLRQLLGGLAGAVGGIGSLRTHAGDAHGQPAGTPQPDSTCARLAVHAASAIAEFLIVTWNRQSSRE